LLARGYQPAVVKVVSYAHGAARATASAQYVERDEVELEAHDGVRLPDKEAVAEEIKAWSASFEKRMPSQDVVTVRVQLIGVRDSDEGRALLSSAVGAAFEGHRHAYRIDVQKDGILEARVVAVMARSIMPEERGKGKAAAVGDPASTAAPSSSKALPSQTPAEKSDRRSLALPSRIRVVEKRLGTTEDAPIGKSFDPRSEAAMKARIETATGYPAHGVSIEPQIPGHGKEALGARLASLVSRAAALDHARRRMATADDVRDATRDWGRYLRSQTPRDTMHMVVSAKAGTDVKDFTNAVRSFLHHQFSDHKFMFGVHTDKAEAGHIHAHAIVAVRSESGTKLHPGPSDLNQWRVTYAAHAREHGLEVVATRAAEQASSRSYGPKDKSIVDVAETPRPQRKEQDRAYANDPRNADLINNAKERIATAHANPIRIPETSRDRAEVTESLKGWLAEAKVMPVNQTVQAMVQRLSAAKAAGEVLGELKDAAKSEVSRSATAMRDASQQGSKTESTPTSDRSRPSMWCNFRV
jgi:type IV secretory pathway VirD2 relaxase